MRTLLLADAVFVLRERSMLRRLEIGLADEGVQVFLALPDTLSIEVGGEMTEGLYARSVRYPVRTLPFLSHLRVGSVVRELSRLDRLDRPQDIDVVHVFGGLAWSLGQQLSRELDAGLALEVWRPGLSTRAASLRHREGDPPHICLCPDPLIEAELAKRAPAAPRAVVPWGVLATDLQPILEPGRSCSIMLVGSGRDQAACSAALTGVARVLQERPDCLLFCEAAAARRAELWKLARSLNVLDRLSLIEDLEGRRDLLLRGDLILHPEASGEQRSVLLEAFACGVPVVAAHDAMSGLLRDGVTAKLVQGRSPDAWRAAISSLLERPELAHALARSAHAWVSTERRASDAIRRVLEVYQTLRSGRDRPGAAAPSVR